MNANQIVNMVVRMVMRRLVRTGVNAGINAAGNRLNKAKPDQATGKPPETAQSTQRAKQAMRMMRRLR